MKKIICFVLVISILALSICSCGKMSDRIEDKDFVLSYAQDSLSVKYCSAENAQRFPYAEVVNCTLKAEDSVLTITHGEEVFVGTYELIKTLDNYVLYLFKIGEEESYASMSKKEHEDGLVEYAIIWSAKGQTLNFTSGKISK